jgi:hypothetical protein
MCVSWPAVWQVLRKCCWADVTLLSVPSLFCC